MAALIALSLPACGREDPGKNLLTTKAKDKKTVRLYSPMEKTMAGGENVARTAFDKTVAMAEEKLGIRMDYITYTADDYQDKTYDDVAFDRARNDMDDLYLLNPDVIRKLAEEGKLVDLSGLDCAKNLREVVKIANVVDGKLVGIPQEVVVYGLFINEDIFKDCGLKMPNTPEEFLECCRVLKENGYETPVGANRWWLETFVFAPLEALTVRVATSYVF